jgi:hypothetical protein
MCSPDCLGSQGGHKFLVALRSHGVKAPLFLIPGSFRDPIILFCWTAAHTPLLRIRMTEMLSGPP